MTQGTFLRCLLTGSRWRYAATAALCQVLLLCGTILAQPPADTSKSSQVSVTEINRLAQEAQRLLIEGKIEESIDAAKRMLAAQLETYDSYAPEIAGTHEFLGDRYLDLEQYDLARQAFRSAQQIYEKSYGPTNVHTVDAAWMLDEVDRLRNLSKEARTQLAQLNLLDAEAFQAYQQGNLHEALRVTKKSLEISLRWLPKSHPDLAGAFNAVGIVFAAMGNSNMALQYYRRSLEVRELHYSKEAYPQGHPNLVSSLVNLATALLKGGQYPAARDYSQRAVEVCEALYPADQYPQGTADLADSLNILGSALANLELRPEARIHLERSLAIREALYPEGDPTLADSHTNLGALLLEQADYAAAMPHFLRALEIAQKANPAEDYPNGHPDIALCHNNMGYALMHQGDFSSAREHLEDAIAMYEQLYPVTSYPQGTPEMAQAITNLGMLFEGQGGYDDARQLLDRALAMRLRLYPPQQFPLGHPELAESYNNLGYLYDSTGEYDRVLEYYGQALAMYERNFTKEDYPRGHIHLAVSLNNLALAHLKKQEYQQSKQLLSDALAMRRRLYPIEEYPKGHPDIAVNLNNLGAVMEFQTNYAEANEYYRQAVSIFEKIYSVDKDSNVHAELYYALENQSRTLVALGRTEEALALVERTEPLRLARLNNVFESSSEEAMRDFLSSNDTTAKWWLSLLRVLPDDPHATELTFQTVVGRKTVLLDALMRRRMVERIAATNPEISEKSHTLRQFRQQLADLDLTPSHPDFDESPSARAQQADELERDLNRALVKFTDTLLVGQVDLAQIRHMLAEGDALIEFVRYKPYVFGAKANQPLWLPPRFVAFVLRKDTQAPAYVDLGDAAEIDQLVEDLRSSVAGAQRQLRFNSEEAVEAEYAALAGKLQETIFAPLERFLTNTKTIFLAPDGELSRIPFEALVDQDGKYLIERFAFAYLTSGSDLTRQVTPSESQATGTIVFAAPDYDLDGETTAARPELVAQLTRGADELWQGEVSETTRGRSWRDLPATRVEADQVVELLKDSEHFGPVTTLLGADALEEYLKRLSAPRILHLATHGYYSANQADTAAENSPTEGMLLSADGPRRSNNFAHLENPLLRSGIVLSGANRTAEEDFEKPPSGEDGWVTAEEIGLLDLQGTELVVLSACETGLGDLRTGEGVSGLRRAFIFAGAETLVTSLYKVPDQSTQELMQTFYERLAAGDSKLSSLRQAQLRMIAKRREENSAAHPFFWASFILVGNPN